MRILIVVLVLVFAGGCTAMVLGGGSSTNPAGATTGADAEITAKIRQHFASDSTIAAYNLGIRTYAGNVTLTGKVENYVAREQAGRLAKATTGVRTVTNQIVVEN